MKLQAVTVSVNYSDFLAHVIPENKATFDKWVIVTDMNDYKTKALCDEHGLTCVQTDVFYTKGIFNKFAGINEGLKEIDEDAWVAFIDSDIILQPETRRILENLNLIKYCIYGIDRVNCFGLQEWLDFKAGKGLVTNNWLLNSAGMEMGSRLVHYYGYENGDGKFAGWQPVGYFQLAHRMLFDHYPENSLGADHCDLAFAREWPRDKRIFIPELLAIHLESEDGHKAINWWGRKSKPFELPIKPIIDEAPSYTDTEITDFNKGMMDFLEKEKEIKKTESEYVIITNDDPVQITLPQDLGNCEYIIRRHKPMPDKHHHGWKRLFRCIRRDVCRTFWTIVSILCPHHPHYR